MDILYQRWIPGYGFEKLLRSIGSMLDDPNLDDPLIPEIAEQFLKDRGEYDRIARQYTIKHATGVIPELPITYPDGTPWWKDMQVLLE
jgi:ubiquitin-conjugating enzyme E2 D/E